MLLFHFTDDMAEIESAGMGWYLQPVSGFLCQGVCISIGSTNEGIIWMKVWIILGKVHHCNRLIYGGKKCPLMLDLFGVCEDIWSENTGNHMPTFI